jgi:hypothetical protein
MQEKAGADFFISYNKADRVWAEWIAWQLEERGYTTVLQSWDIRPGSNFVLEMQKAAAESERTLAVEYAYRHATEYEVIWWVHAEEIAALNADYSSLAAQLDLPEKGETDQSAIVKAVRRWFGKNGDWLMVFDNARSWADICDYLPQSGTGHVLITSRDANWKGAASALR